MAKLYFRMGFFSRFQPFKCTCNIEKKKNDQGKLEEKKNMPKKIKFLLVILGMIALLYHPVFSVYILGISTKTLVLALASNIAVFIGSTIMFYCVWLLRYKTINKEDKNSVVCSWRIG